MKLDRDAAKKLASLSAVGLGAMATANEAEAAVIIVDATNTMVGWKSGASLGFSHNFGGPRFLFDRYQTSSTITSNGVDVHGYDGLDFLATSSGFLKIVPFGSSGGTGTGATNPQIAYWHRHSASTHPGGTSPFANRYALFRFIVSGLTHYGWIELSLENPAIDQGPTLTIHRFAWSDIPETFLNAGDELDSSPVPEPSAFLMSGLGALGLGAAGIRRWRAAKKAT